MEFVDFHLEFVDIQMNIAKNHLEFDDFRMNIAEKYLKFVKYQNVNGVEFYPTGWKFLERHILQNIILNEQMKTHQIIRARFTPALAV